MRLLFSGLLWLALGLLLFLNSACSHANLTGFAAVPKQTACIFQPNGSSVDSFPDLANWPGWKSFEENFQKDLEDLPNAKLLLSPFCLQGALQWLAIWELEESVSSRLIRDQTSWGESTFQQRTIYFKEGGHAVCVIDNLVLYASMPILIEDALRALDAPDEWSLADNISFTPNAWTLIPSNLKEAGQSCWNMPVVQGFLSTLPNGVWSGLLAPDSTLVWQGSSISPKEVPTEENRFPFWQVMPVDLVWGSFSSAPNHPSRQFWQEPLRQISLGSWFMQGSLESQPTGDQDLFAAVQITGALDSLLLPGLPDPSLVPDFPMLSTHRVEAQADRSAYWVFQLEDVLFLVPSREQAYTLITRFINNQTLETLGGQYQQALSGKKPFQFLYYRSALDEAWYRSVWQKGTTPALRDLSLQDTYLLGQATDRSWHWVQQEDRQGVPPKTDRTFYLQDT